MLIVALCADSLPAIRDDRVNQRLRKTFDLLAATRNEAAVDLLAQALDANSPTMRDAAVECILRSRNPRAHGLLVDRWKRLKHSAKAAIVARPAVLTRAIRDALLSPDRDRCLAACAAAVELREYDLLPTLVNAVEDKAHPHRTNLAETLLNLAELLDDERKASRQPGNGRDPAPPHEQAIACLEESVSRFVKHERREPVEAFLLLAGHGNETLNRVLRNPREPAYLVVLDILTRSARPAVLRLLMRYLEDAHSPSATIGVLAHRVDDAFLPLLLRRIGNGPSAAAAANLRKIKAVGWTHEPLNFLCGCDEQEQRGAAEMAMLSGIDRRDAFRVVEFLLQHGNRGGRRAASAALRDFHGVEVNALILAHIDDDDPHVQANAIRQLRERGIVGVVARALPLLDSPHEIVREAIRECLSEFSIQRFLATFDTLAEDVRRNTGMLVKRIDSDTIAVLINELESSARTRQLRGLEVAEVIDAVADVQQSIIPLLKNDDRILRAAAARALAGAAQDKARLAAAGAGAGNFAESAAAWDKEAL